MTQQKNPKGALVVVPAKDGEGFYFEAKFRHEGKQVKRRLKGRAWVVPVGQSGAKPNGRTVGQYRERRGEVPADALGVDDAVVAMREVIEQYVAEQGKAKPERVTFRRAARDWYDERSAVAGWKATTRRNYEALLRDEDHGPKRRGRMPRARLMRTFGGMDVGKITTADVRAFLRELDGDPALSARSVNAHRQLLAMVMDHAVGRGWREDNPVVSVPKRREADARELVVYSPQQVMAIAEQMGWPAGRALVITLGFAGLRLGEALELRWRDVNFARETIHVQRSFVSGIGVSSPKGRRGRIVPLADVVAEELARLGQRGFLVGQRDLLFPGLTSGFTTKTQRHLDPSVVRAKYMQARDRARQDDPDMPLLRLHDLRHTFGSLAASGGMDLVRVQAIMGHTDSRTTARYLHSISRADDARRLSEAFRSGTVAEAMAETADAA